MLLPVRTMRDYLASQRSSYPLDHKLELMISAEYATAPVSCNDLSFFSGKVKASISFNDLSFDTFLLILLIVIFVSEIICINCYDSLI